MTTETTNAPDAPGASNLGGGASVSTTNAPESGVDKPRRGRKPAAPITNPDTLTGAEAEAFAKKPGWEQAEIRAKFAMQEARRMREEAKGTKTEGGGRQKTMPAPSFTLAHSFGTLMRPQIVPPADGSRPDASVARIVRDFGFIAPLLVVAEADGRFSLLDARYYALIPEDKPVPVVAVSGFPSPEWVDAAAAVMGSAQPANAFGLASILGRLRQRGWDDKALRSRLGLKAGEIEKFEALNNLPDNIRAGVSEGRVTDSVALLVAKQTPAIRERLAQVFGQKTNDKADARLTEADVEEARKARTADAVKRDQPALVEAMGSVPDSVDDANRTDTPAAPAPLAPPSPATGAPAPASPEAMPAAPLTTNAPAPGAPAPVSPAPAEAPAPETPANP